MQLHISILHFQISGLKKTRRPADACFLNRLQRNSSIS